MAENNEVMEMEPIVEEYEEYDEYDDYDDYEGDGTAKGIVEGVGIGLGVAGLVYVAKRWVVPKVVGFFRSRKGAKAELEEVEVVETEETKTKAKKEKPNNSK